MFTMRSFRLFLPSGKSEKHLNNDKQNPNLEGNATIHLTGHAPRHGSVFMPTINDLGDMRRDPQLIGILEIDLPSHLGRRRCQAIRVGMKSVCKLDLGRERGKEENVIFERTIELKSRAGDWIILDPGIQR